MFEFGAHLREGAGANLVSVGAELEGAFAANNGYGSGKRRGVSGELSTRREGKLDNLVLVVVVKRPAEDTAVWDDRGGINVSDESVWGSGCHALSMHRAVAACT